HENNDIVLLGELGQMGLTVRNLSANTVVGTKLNPFLIYFSLLHPSFYHFFYFIETFGALGSLTVKRNGSCKVNLVEIVFSGDNDGFFFCLAGKSFYFGMSILSVYHNLSIGGGHFVVGMLYPVLQFQHHRT